MSTTPIKKINRRMRYILSQVRDGVHPKTIAHELGLGTTTISYNLKQAQLLLNANTTTHTVVTAIGKGLISGRGYNGELTHPDRDVPFDLDFLGKHEGHTLD